MSRENAAVGLLEALDAIVSAVEDIDKASRVLSDENPEDGNREWEMEDDLNDAMDALHDVCAGITAEDIALVKRGLNGLMLLDAIEKVAVETKMRTRGDAGDDVVKLGGQVTTFNTGTQKILDILKEARWSSC